MGGSGIVVDHAALARAVTSLRHHASELEGLASGLHAKRHLLAEAVGFRPAASVGQDVITQLVAALDTLHSAYSSGAKQIEEASAAYAAADRNAAQAMSGSQ